MVELRRTVRFSISGEGDSRGGRNGFGGRPPMRGIGRYFEFEVRCVGEPDASTGYLIDIKRIDDAVRAGAIPMLADTCDRDPQLSPEAMISALLQSVHERLGPLARAMVWRLTPAQSVEAMIGETTVPISETTRVLVRQRFDFAAAHRLHVPSLSDDENRRLFGKCNNPAGHGHNYQVEVCVAAQVSDGAPAIDADTIERLVDERIIDRFDHKHLNVDTEEFRDGSGVNPTVENISRVCYERLAPAIEGAGARLASVTVWETDRTSSTYPAGL